ncbi:hypothetical protein EVAR_103222_1 [Eumeta japonica]|uniref:Uncharacterized protein n=1 Tax=Eumeta variegata TaxID=151549 RepID=A0A4C1X631_EUMVA|nr:hypothetical protein EVAR_103222_1 [Eumeta japonica]
MIELKGRDLRRRSARWGIRTIVADGTIISQTKAQRALQGTQRMVCFDTEADARLGLEQTLNGDSGWAMLWTIWRRHQNGPVRLARNRAFIEDRREIAAFAISFRPVSDPSTPPTYLPHSSDMVLVLPNAQVTPLGLRVSTDGGDHLLSFC